MRNSWIGWEHDINRGTTPGTGVAPLRAVAAPFEDWATWQPEEAIQLDSCLALEQIVVRTCSSVYEVIVLCGDTGEVLVRGGHFFPDFQHARVEGSTAGGSAVKLRNICVGLHMELNVGAKFFITSTIQAEMSSRVSARSFSALDSESEDVRVGSGEPGAGSSQQRGTVANPNLAT